MRLALCLLPAASLLLPACVRRIPDARADALASPCGLWAGVARVGTRWMYEPTETYQASLDFDGEYTIEVAAIDGERVTLSQVGAYSGDAGSFTWSRTDTWRCDAAGAWWIRSEASVGGTSQDQPIRQVGWRTFTPGWLVRPAVLDESWADAFTVTQSVNGGEPRESAASCVTSPSEVETRTVGGRAVPVRQVMPVCEGIVGIPSWLGAGVGLVETEDERLVGYWP
ncbi:MAG: hypothetical protein Q8P18_09000 [Pseudomonadota bacterium]|nr:hypothetical protein [Pseudomonadota bacterium]